MYQATKYLLSLNHTKIAFLSGPPDDVSVIGSDDIYLASHTNPALTSISQPHYRAGQLAVQKISNSLSGARDDTEGVTMLSCPLAVRESTGPCPAQIMS